MADDSSGCDLNRAGRTRPSWYLRAQSTWVSNPAGTTTQFWAEININIAFGHGEHACPGRFFAANEVKVMLCHLVMKYDWTLTPGTDGRFVNRGTSLSTSPDAKIRIQRRQDDEWDIDSLLGM